MEVILRKDVKGTGKEGDIVKVNDGFARNKLIPSGAAIEATEANKRAVAREKANYAKKCEEDRKEATLLAEKLQKKPIVIKTKVGDAGKLFGSITSMDIAAAIKEQAGVEIDKKKIVLDKPIKEIGENQVTAKLYEGIAATISVEIQGE